jgi:glycine/D-amino acid oxidase-like deaminating enzyme
MGLGSEKIPSVAEVQPRVFSLVGMGGMGVALAPVMARQAAKRMVE